MFNVSEGKGSEFEIEKQLFCDLIAGTYLRAMIC